MPTAALGIVTHSNAVANLNEYSRESMQERTVPFASAAPSAEHGSANGDSRPCDIRFENVTFSYPGTNRPVLRNLSLAIPHGGVVAVLGRSGAGKSTFTSLLRGEGAPDSGRIFVGDTDTACQEFSAMRLVGVIQQNPHIFNQSLRENLLIGKGNATDDELWDALERVGLRPRAEQLPNGLDTVIDESGKSFSGGERHRIALARILLSKPAIVILDEPFAGLDPATEQALLETMLSALEGSTVLLITHHLQGVSHADRVLFFENGSIAMDGSPAELERSNERYRTLLAFDSGNVGPSSSHEAK